jgi:uncharacterized protein YndB with AHSA1/START domain
MAEEMTPDTVYITYIAAAAEQVWNALTLEAFTKHFFFGMHIHSEWRVGEPWTLYTAEGARAVSGTVLAAERPNLLRVSWIVEGADLPECIVTYAIETQGMVVKLTMTEHHPSPLDPSWLEGGKEGWPKILSGLKTLLETDSVLPIPMPSPPEDAAS